MEPMYSKPIPKNHVSMNKVHKDKYPCVYCNKLLDYGTLKYTHMNTCKKYNLIV